MPDPEHIRNQVESVACALITVSDTRTTDTDKSGAILRDRIEAAGHRVFAYEIIPDEPKLVSSRVRELCDDQDCHAVLLTGGTGISRRDSTFEAVSALFDKSLDGFGELFRMLSYEEIGAAAMLSRATAGICRSTVVFSMPGSTAAVTLAIDKLILEKLGHLVWLLREG